MRKCNYCGFENPDEATQCITCHTSLVASVPSNAARRETVTPLNEQRFWERMNFRQFAALFLRLQAVWLLWYAVLDLTYIPSYIARSYAGGIYIIPEARLGFLLLILRVILHVAAAVAVIRYADRLLSWLVKDWIRNEPFNKSLEPPAAAPSISDAPGSPNTGNKSASVSGGGGSA